MYTKKRSQNGSHVRQGKTLIIASNNLSSLLVGRSMNRPSFTEFFVMEPVQPVPLSAGKKNNCDQAPKTQMTLMTLPLVISCGFTLFWDPQGSTFLSRPQAITQAARKSCTSRSPVPAHHGTMRVKSMKSVHRTWQEVVTLCWFKLCNCAALPAALPADSVQNGSHEG